LGKIDSSLGEKSTEALGKMAKNLAPQRRLPQKTRKTRAFSKLIDKSFASA
jgi:hypothetical protein